MNVLLALTIAVAVFAAIDSPGRHPARPGRSVPVVVVGLAGGVAIVSVTGSFVLLILAPVLSLSMVWFIRHERRRRVQLAELRQLPVVVDILARRVGVGATVAGALGSLTDEQLAASRLRPVLQRIRSGSSTADALADSPGLVSAALYAAEIAGASGGPAIERLADRLRSAALDGRAAQSQSGQQLASAAVMTLLPPVVSVLYALSDDRAAQFYLQTPWGGVVIAVSFAFSAAGWFWMRFITRPRAIQ